MKAVLLQAPREDALNLAAAGNGAGRGNVPDELQRCDWRAGTLQGFPRSVAHVLGDSEMEDGALQLGICIFRGSCSLQQFTLLRCCLLANVDW